MAYRIGDDCRQCGRCQEICPAGAIVNEGRRYVIIPDKCESCGACAAECPEGAIESQEEISNAVSGVAGAKPPRGDEPARRNIHRHRSRLMEWIGGLLPGMRERWEKTGTETDRADAAWRRGHRGRRFEGRRALHFHRHRHGR